MSWDDGILRAKSVRIGGTTLLEHTRPVMQAAAHFAKMLGFDDAATVQLAAAMHDAGKAHPKFQRQLAEADRHVVWASIKEREDWDFPHRHEISSLLLLLCCPRDE